MTDLARARQNIQVEESQYGAGVSEYSLQKIGAAINFINDRQYQVRKVAFDGPYWVATVPMTGVEALEPFPFNVEIINCAMYNMVAGASGTTEIDVQVCATSGAAFASIFTITPKIAYNAGNNNYFLMKDSAGAANSAGTGQTMPTWSATYIDATTGHLNVAAGAALRFDLVQTQSAEAENAGLILYYRPR